ncbi:MAG: DUF3891 family protein [Rubrobacteraceae bacterium]
MRERPDSFVLIEQHEHALISAEFARHWSKSPHPPDSTLYAVAHHDVAWRGPDLDVSWNEDRDRPYSFVDYPPEPKVRAYTEGLNQLEIENSYAAYLCSLHYTTLMQASNKEAEIRFVTEESRRQERLRAGMSEEEAENVGRNLRFLKLCDGLSLFVCLNEPGGSDYPPPYPDGFSFDGEHYDPQWTDRRTLRIDPDPLSEPFEISIPYKEFGKDRHPLESGRIELQVSQR